MPKEFAGTRLLQEDEACSWSKVGQNLYGDNPADEYGYAVDMSNDGRTIVTGSRLHEGDAGTWSGHVQVLSLDRNNETWIQLGEDLEGSKAGDRFGFAVAIPDDGTTVASGSLFTFGINDGVHSGNGYVRVFRFDEDRLAWRQLGVDIVGEGEADLSGY